MRDMASLERRDDFERLHLTLKQHRWLPWISDWLMPVVALIALPVMVLAEPDSLLMGVAVLLALVALVALVASIGKTSPAHFVITPTEFQMDAALRGFRPWKRQLRWTWQGLKVRWENDSYVNLVRVHRLVVEHDGGRTTIPLLQCTDEERETIVALVEQAQRRAVARHGDGAGEIPAALHRIRGVDVPAEGAPVDAGAPETRAAAARPPAVPRPTRTPES